jgi:short subunit dehydrogenase-like uncharacterized protein
MITPHGHNDPDMKNFLIYGSYGYTGRLIVEQAVKEGLHPILAGRDEIQLQAQAGQFGLEFRAFDLKDANALNATVHEVDAVLHCAGPFSLTFEPMIRACLENRKHYVDISGEIEEFESLAGMDDAARKAGIMVLPGAGFDVVPSDCLAVYLGKKLPTATKLELNIMSVGSGISRGTARSAIENMHRQGRIRRNGKIVSVPGAWRVKQVDFGRGPRRVMSMGWGDVSTAWYSTHIPNIEAYMAFPSAMINLIYLTRFAGPLLYTRPMKNFLKWAVGKAIRPGPSRERNRTGLALFIGEVTDGSRTVRAKLRTPEAYQLTALTSVEIMKRILSSDYEAGFQTAGKMYGEDFITQFPGVEREDLKEEIHARQGR